LAAALAGVPAWTEQGPGPTINGQVENIGTNPVVGAIKAVVADPGDFRTIYIGTVNGGIWKTTTSPNPAWQPLTDQYPSLSIGALALDPTDASNQTLVAGIGRYSSYLNPANFVSFGGPLTGILRSADGGAHWTQLGTAAPGGATRGLAGVNISAVAPRGATIFVGADNNGGGVGPGLYRSTDGGTTFNLVSVAAPGPNQVGAGPVFDLVGDPAFPNRLLAAVGGAGAGRGIYMTNDLGNNWTKLTNRADANFSQNGAITATITAATMNMKFAVHYNATTFTRAYYVGIENTMALPDNPNAVQLANVFRCDVSSLTFDPMMVPQTGDAGGPYGINPGGQGRFNFSIAADPQNPNVVYVGGDRQPVIGAANVLGAIDFSGRLFRGTFAAAGTMWASITNNGTANNSSPHADSRLMTFDQAGDLLEADDGGLYFRTSPQDNTGRWNSLIGNLRDTEFHDSEWDSENNAAPGQGFIIGGAQDTGTPQQPTTGAAVWNTVVTPAGPQGFSTGDGADVAVDNLSLGPDPATGAFRSIRYSSFPNLGDFRRQTFADGVLVAGSQVNPALTVAGTGVGIQDLQFYTPIEVNQTNAASATRLLFGGFSQLYESTDQGATLNPLLGVAITGTTGLGVMPITITAPGHGFANGNVVLITGVRGNTNANNFWVIANVTANTFQLVGSVGNAAYAGGGRAVLVQNAAGGAVIQNGVNSIFGGNEIAYGGQRGGVDNPDVFYAASGTQVLVRTAAGRAVARTVPPGATMIRGVAVDPTNWMTAYAIDDRHVFMTANAGTNWNDITGNLLTGLVNSDFHSVTVIPGGVSAVMVGGVMGVSRMFSNSLRVWSRFGSGLPNMLSFDLEYNAIDNVLLVGTLGRGAWTVPNVRATAFTPPSLTVDAGNGPNDIIRLVKNPFVPTLLDVFVNGTLDLEVPLATLQMITVNGGLNGGDSIQIGAVPTGAKVTVNLTNGGNTVTVGSDLRTLDCIMGMVTVKGGGISDSLIVDDAGSGAPHTYTLGDAAGAGLVSAFRTGATITYSQITNFTLNAGTGKNTINVQTTQAGTITTINAGPAGDTINVGNRLDFIRGPLTLNGPGASTKPVLNINDQGAAAAQQYTLSATTVQRTGAATITYQNIKKLSITVTNFPGNIIRVASTAATTPVALTGGGGNNTLVGPDAANTWHLTGTGAGTLSGTLVAGLLTFTQIQNLSGGSNTDLFRFEDGQGVAGKIDGGGGTNTLDYSAYTSNVIVDLQTDTATGVGATIANIGNVNGGNGPGYNILVGNGGNGLNGGNARSLLIAGASHSVLTGGNDEDILIGGTTAYDTNIAALVAIMAEWSRTDETYDVRVNHLMNGGGNNDPFRLNATTVTGNGGGNTLMGGAGRDLFFGNLGSDTTDWDPLSETFVSI
jgi:hypothetical protein